MVKMLRNASNLRGGPSHDGQPANASGRSSGAGTATGNNWRQLRVRSFFAHAPYGAVPMS